MWVDGKLAKIRDKSDGGKKSKYKMHREETGEKGGRRNGKREWGTIGDHR